MGVAKVVLDGVTQMDITNSTVTESTLGYDIIAHGADGEIIYGRAQKNCEDAILSQTLKGTYYNPTVTSAGIQILQSNSELKKAILPNLTIAEYQAFYNCQNLEEIDMPKLAQFPNAYGQITWNNNNNSNTFKNDIKLGGILIFPNVTNNLYNKHGIFYGCSSLEVVYFPNATQQNCTDLFHDCTNLKAYGQPKCNHATTAYNSLNTYMFAGCTSLEIIDAGSTKQINQYALQNCSSLNTLIIRSSSLVSMGNINAIAGSSLDSTGKGCTIYIKKAYYDQLGTGSSSDYKAASNWSTIDAYGTITWAQLEDSVYETKSIYGWEF